MPNFCPKTSLGGNAYTCHSIMMSIVRSALEIMRNHTTVGMSLDAFLVLQVYWLVSCSVRFHGGECSSDLFLHFSLQDHLCYLCLQVTSGAL